MVSPLCCFAWSLDRERGRLPGRGLLFLLLSLDFEKGEGEAVVDWHGHGLFFPLLCLELGKGGALVSGHAL